MPSIQITSTNYNGQIAQVTFYSVNAPATPVSLGSHTMPYVRTDNDVYGTYELNFAAYSKICSVSLSAPTTTTTAAPTTTTTVAPTTTTTTTTAPTTTTTTTTASPAGAFTLSGAGNTNVNGCYVEAGTHNGNPYYTNGSYYVWYDGYEFSWFINEFVGSGAPGYYGNGSDDSTLPEIWTAVFEPAPEPTISNGCGETTTTTTTTTAAPTTTTAAPLVGYSLSGSYDYSGNYTTSGTLDGQPAWQHSTKSYVITYAGGSSVGWMLFPGTISGGLVDGPISSHSCGYPAGGSGTCTVETITGTWSTAMGGGSDQFTVTSL